MMEKRIFDNILQRLGVIAACLSTNDKEKALVQIQLLRGYMEGVRDSQYRHDPANDVFNR